MSRIGENNLGDTTSSNVVRTNRELGKAESYIRANTIQFYAEGLKPNTRYWPFFDNVFVGHLCVPIVNNGATGPSLSSAEAANTTINALKTGPQGRIDGVFFLPELTFKGRSHTFTLVDGISTTTNGAIIPNPVYGSATAQYTVVSSLKDVVDQVAENTVNLEYDPPTVEPNTVYIDGSAAVKAPGPLLFENWYFEYTITNVVSDFFTIVTNSATAPTTTEAKNKYGHTYSSNSVVTVTFISTESLGKNTWKHKFRVSSSEETRTLRQEKIVQKLTTDAETLASLPSLTTFRPSGVDDNDIINIKKQWTKIGEVPQPPANYTVQRHDCLAQSFFINPARFPDGLFVTSIEVFFKTVDNATPIVLQLREMLEGGTPSSTILPHGRVLLPGAAVAASDDASVSTIFRFNRPVYLKPSTDYCFVLRSSSMGYNVWCSQVGQTDVTTGTIIDEQPFNGTLFKTENGRTWTPDQYQDVKFTLNKASFDTTKTAKLKFWPKTKTTSIAGSPVSVYRSTERILSLTNITTTKDQKYVDINVPGHGVKNNDVVYIKDVYDTSLNGLTKAGLQGTFTATRIDDDNIRITTTSATNASVSGQISAPLTTVVYNTNQPADINELPQINSIHSNNGNNSPASIPGSTGAGTMTISDVQYPYTFKIYTGLKLDEFFIDYVGGLLNGNHTNVTETIKLAKDNVSFPTTKFQSSGSLDVDQDTHYSDGQSYYLINPANETSRSSELDNEKSLEVNMTLASTNKDISPTLNLNNVSLMMKKYVINNQFDEWTTPVTTLQNQLGYVIKTLGTVPWTSYGYDGSTGVVGGSFVANLTNGATGIAYQSGEVYKISEVVPNVGLASAKYKSPIQLLNNSYNTLYLRVTGICPSPALFDVYVRVSADETTHVDKEWIWLPAENTNTTDPFSAFEVTSDNKTMKDWTYKYTNTQTTFDLFDVKVVMRSSNTSVVPKIYSIQVNARNELV